jgi:hypothetical protein
MVKMEMKTIREIDKAIQLIDEQRVTLLQERQSLETARDVMYKINNVCAVCDGIGHTYRDSNLGDPYERSSDREVDCTKCKGTGNYSK